MAKALHTRKERQKLLKDKIKEDPFLTDEQLAKLFGVSIQTVRLDRLSLDIPELRERVKDVARDNNMRVKSLGEKDIVGEIIHIELGVQAISVFKTTEEMCFDKNQVVRGHYIYSLAESLAISVIDASVALVGVANIKYKIPVLAHKILIAKAQLRKTRGNSFFVWVSIFQKSEEVFRGKFILVSEAKNRMNE
jgi:acyl-coenzyme A thioesterase PaaI-like protein